MSGNITSVNDIIVEAKGHLPLNKISGENILDRINVYRERIKHYMLKEGYYPLEGDDFFSDNYIYLTPDAGFQKVLEQQSFKRALEKFHSTLKVLVPSIPLKVSFLFSFCEKNDKNQIKENVNKTDLDGLIVIIRSEPVALYQLRMFSNEIKFTDFDISDIIETNIQFIREILYSFNMVIIENPTTIRRSTELLIAKKLLKLDFTESAQLLVSGKEKIEEGRIEDGLTDARSALESCISQILSKLGYKSHKIFKRNIDEIKKHNIIKEQIINFVSETIYDWIYRYISNQAVHKREKINLLDARFIFTVIENTLDYFVTKLIIYAV